MTRWEYLKISAYFSGGGRGIHMRLTPKRDSHAKLVAALGLELVDEEPAIHRKPWRPHDTIVLVPWDTCDEKFYAIIDAVTADGWEPFSVHDDHLTRVVHLRRNTQ